MFSRLCSPWGGEPLWTGQVAGEPFKSASVTAEAGKLPTLSVRPFWPFQVVELGLWEEAGEGGESKQGVEAGLPPAFGSQAVCHGAASAWKKESPFLPNTKRLYGLLWLQPGGQDWWSSQGPVGRGGNGAEDQG